MNKFINNLTATQKGLVVAILSIVIYLVSASLTFSIFSGSVGIGGSNLQTSLPGPSDVLEEDPNEPRTEACPLNGNMHTKKAKQFWETRRPLAVMIENHQEARPQSGLTSADVVYEAVAEGGITRFMAVFLCNLSDNQVGPVRSARTYFLDWLSEYDALYAHVGGANTPGPANALGQIIDYDIKDMNQFSIGFPTFWRDYQRLGHPVATEHTMYSTTQKLWEIGAKRGWTATDSAGLRWDANFKQWDFKDDQPGQGSAPSANKIVVDFWQSQGDYQVQWDYDPTCNCYKRSNGGAPHMDLNNNKQISPKVVIVRFMKESRANDGYEGNAHLLYGNKGQGRAIIFQDGKAIEGKWMKANRLGRETFVDANGKVIPLNRGQIWLETVPEGSQVTF